MNAELYAPVEAAKISRAEKATAHDEAAIVAAADVASLTVTRAEVATLEQRRANAVAACKPQAVLDVDALLLRARVTVEIETAKAAASASRHASTAAELHAAEMAVEAAAKAYLDAVMIALSGKVEEYLDLAIEYGEELRALADDDPTNRKIGAAPVMLPPEVVQAIARLPRLHVLDTPLNVLRGGNGASGPNERARRLAELIAR